MDKYKLQTSLIKQQFHKTLFFGYYKMYYLMFIFEIDIKNG